MVVKCAHIHITLIISSLSFNEHRASGAFLFEIDDWLPKHRDHHSRYPYFCVQISIF